MLLIRADHRVDDFGRIFKGRVSNEDGHRKTKMWVALFQFGAGSLLCYFAPLRTTDTTRVRFKIILVNGHFNLLVLVLFSMAGK